MGKKWQFATDQKGKRMHLGHHSLGLNHQIPERSDYVGVAYGYVLI